MNDTVHTEPLSRRKRRKEQTYRRLLQVAEALFRSRGYDATTVEEIAELADVAKGTVFNYFDNKAGILRAILFSRTQPLLQSPPGADQPAPERIHLLLTALWQELAPYRHIARRIAAYNLAQAEPEFPPVGVTLPSQALAHLIRQGQTQGHFRTDINAELAGELFATYFFHIFISTTHYKTNDNQTNSELLQQCLDLLYLGLYTNT